MQATRQPAVAGRFYPGVRDQLDGLVDELLAGVDADEGDVPKAIIAPHAGFVYSGAVAASAYARLAPARERITRVVLLGPSHRVALRGLGAPSVEAFLTPLGAIPIDRAAIQQVLRLPQVQVLDEAHAYEHSLEVQLPFLQKVLERFSLVPFSVGDASPEEVAVVLEALWGGPETLIVVSSDLSHYYDYETARRMDAATTAAIERLDPEGLDRESACGRVPVRGLLVCARRHGLAVDTVDLRNSGDTAGSRDQVVGYGSYLFRPSDGARERAEEAGAEDEDAHDDRLLEFARRSIEHGAQRAAGPWLPPLEDLPAPLRAIRSSFVTLKLDGRLRGCIGSLEARLPLAEDVARSAFKAAYEDPRFAPVSDEERPRLDVHVSVLSPMSRVLFGSEAELLAQLRVGVDGLVLQDAGRRGTFLPSVWEELAEPREFLRRLKQKAGLPPDHWSESLEIYRYTTRSIE